VVRRNPDIKWLRRPEDIAQLAAQQAVMLDTLWRLLVPVVHCFTQPARYSMKKMTGRCVRSWRATLETPNVVRLLNLCPTGHCCPMPSMMVFFTPCCARSDPALRWLAGLLLGCWLAVAGSALASEKSTIKQAVIQATPQGYVLDADINFVLNPTLEDALAKGINLYFLLELELTRPRNWWYDETIAEPIRKLRIYYHLLLRRYVGRKRLHHADRRHPGRGAGPAGAVEGWQVLERGALKPRQRYDARLRLRLDTAQLPKPLSFGAVTSDKWELISPWYSWSFDAPAAPAPAP